MRNLELVDSITEKFFHVDRHNNLQQGDELELEWPGYITDNHRIEAPPDDLEVLKELYPEGLSRHGARYAYAQTVTRTDLQEKLPEKVKPRVGNLPTSQGNVTMQENVVHIERYFEMIRRAEFSNERSRLQSLFAFSDIKDAIKFLEKGSSTDNEPKIVEVRGQEHDIKDMELLKVTTMADIFSKGRKYWRGKASPNPTWEVLIEPPVEVLNVINNPRERVQS